MSEKKYLLGLSMIEGLGPIFITKLLRVFGNAKEIWNATDNSLKKIEGIGETRIRKINKFRNSLDLDLEIKKLKSKGVNFICLEDDNYPERLKNIYDPPPVLFYKGKEIFNIPAVAIVGSRRASVYGRETAMKLARGLSRRGITIVSGMALGIDSAGHQGALSINAKTIAVLGSGVDYIYPPENNHLYYKIQNKGAILSEFPPNIKPIPAHFPRRNRIISGLSQGVIVVEAAQRSGSLITADFALEQGREVFAVPGNINRYQSKGANNLIKKGAVMVTSVDDILEEIYLYNNSNDNTERTVYPELNKEEELIISLFKDNDELYFDQLYENSGLEKNILSSSLLKLELKGLIELKAGKKYLFKGLQKLLKPL